MNIKSETPTSSICSIGSFTVKSGAIRFTDPCYGDGVWCKGSMPAVNGRYQVQIGFFRDLYDEMRLKSNILTLKYALKCVEGMKTPADMSSAKAALRAYRAYEKANGNRLETPYSAVTYPAESQMLVDAIVSSVDPSDAKPSWWAWDGWVNSKIGETLLLVTGSDSNLLSVMFKVEVAKLSAKHLGKSATDQDYFEVEKAEILEGIKSLLSSRVKAFDEGKPKRTHFLQIKHESLPEFTPFSAEDWNFNDTFDVGVDSGQAGFFDEAWFSDSYAKFKKGDEPDDAWREIYKMLCQMSEDISNSSKEGGAFEFGVSSYTAHGDGSALLFYRTNELNEVLEAAYHYDIDIEEGEGEE